MSSAFVREGEELRLSDVAPNLSALQLYLRRENGGHAHTRIKNLVQRKTWTGCVSDERRADLCQKR